MLEAALNEVHLEMEQPSPEEVEGLASSAIDLVAKLDDKLARLPGLQEGSDLEAMRTALLREYISKRAVEAELWKRLPALVTQVGRKLQASEEKLPLRYGPAAGQSVVPMKAIADDLVAAIQPTLPGYQSEVADCLAWGTICDWLMRCPLNWAES